MLAASIFRIVGPSLGLGCRVTVICLFFGILVRKCILFMLILDLLNSVLNDVIMMILRRRLMRVVLVVRHHDQVVVTVVATLHVIMRDELFFFALGVAVLLLRSTRPVSIGAALIARLVRSIVLLRLLE